MNTQKFNDKTENYNTTKLKNNFEKKLSAENFNIEDYAEKNKIALTEFQTNNYVSIKNDSSDSKKKKIATPKKIQFKLCNLIFCEKKSYGSYKILRNNFVKEMDIIDLYFFKNNLKLTDKMIFESEGVHLKNTINCYNFLNLLKKSPENCKIIKNGYSRTKLDLLKNTSKIIDSNKLLVDQMTQMIR